MRVVVEWVVQLQRDRQEIVQCGCWRPRWTVDDVIVEVVVTVLRAGGAQAVPVLGTYRGGTAHAAVEASVTVHSTSLALNSTLEYALHSTTDTPLLHFYNRLLSGSQEL